MLAEVQWSPCLSLFLAFLLLLSITLYLFLVALLSLPFFLSLASSLSCSLSLSYDFVLEYSASPPPLCRGFDRRVSSSNVSSFSARPLLLSPRPATVVAAVVMYTVGPFLSMHIS